VVTGHREPALVAELSNSWVQALAAQLAESGRRLEGGWPGTLSDARRLLARRLGALPTAVTRSEFDGLVKAIYVAAKRQWGQAARRAPSEPSDTDD
jgi:hypothetical protein